MNLNETFRRDSALLAWSATFAAKIAGESATEFGLSAQQATEYQTTQTRFADAMKKCDDRDNRTRTDTIIKNEARDHLVNASRMLVDICEAWPQMTDAKRSQLNIPIHDRTPTRRGRPETAPILEIVSQRGLRVKLGLRDSLESTRRRRPQFVIGATILTHVGEEAPADISGWTFNGNHSKTTGDVDFPAMTPRGSKVWFTAVWYNQRSESGPPSRPQFTYVSGADGLAKAA